MYEINLRTNMTYNHRRGIEEAIWKEKNPLKAKRTRNLFKGGSIIKLVKTPYVNLKVIQDLITKHNLKPYSTFQVLWVGGGEKNFNKTFTVKDLQDQLRKLGCKIFNV